MSDAVKPDLGEYAGVADAGGVLARRDLAQYDRTLQGVGALGKIDLGEFARVTEEYGTLAGFDLGEYPSTTLGGGVLGDVDLGEFARVTEEYGTLPDFDLGEHPSTTLGGGVLPHFDLGEYSYIWAWPPAGALFPEMSGLQWDVLQQPEFSTKIGRGRSAREYRSALMPAPRWNVTLRYDLLRDDTYDLNLALQRLYGFFLQRMGTFDSFLYTNPRDNVAAGEVFGAGDGVTQSFQLARSYGAGGFTFNENVKNVKRLTSINVDGVSTSGHYRGNSCVVDAYGVATFERPPAAGEVLSWDGTFFYRCRFADDLTSFDNFTAHFWSCGGLKLVGSPDNLI